MRLTEILETFPRGCFVFESRVSTKTVVMFAPPLCECNGLILSIASSYGLIYCVCFIKLIVKVSIVRSCISSMCERTVFMNHG